MTVVFLAATAWSLRGPPTPTNVLMAVVGGLTGLLVFQFTVGNVWAYAVEYRNSGGRWTDLPFVAPFAVAAAGAGGTYLWTSSVAAAGWAAFWTFAVAAAVVALVAWLSVGYREASA
jgi:hypothetical protein